MKNRKTVVVAFMLCAVMLLGVGYAALTDTLTITGDLATSTTAAMTEFDGEVYFSSANVVSDDTGNQAAISILEGRDDAKIEAKHFTVKNQKVVAKLTITNDAGNEFAAAIAAGALTVTNNAEDHDPIFNVTWSWAADGTPDHSAVTLAPGESKDVYVTIVLLETPTEAHTATFSVAYTATSVELP